MPLVVTVTVVLLILLTILSGGLVTIPLFVHQEAAMGTDATMIGSMAGITVMRDRWPDNPSRPKPRCWRHSRAAPLNL